MFTRNNKNIDELVNEATLLFESGNFDGGLEKIDQAIFMQPRNLEFHHLKTDMLFSEENFSETIKELKFIELLEHGNASNYSLESLCYLNIDDPAKALDSANKAIKEDPGIESAYYHKAMALEDLGELDDAIAAYKLASEKDPSNPDIHRDLGSMYFDQTKYSAALREVKLAMRFNKNDKITNTLMASLQLEKGDFDGFFKTLTDAYKNSGDADYLVRIINFFVENGDIEQAESLGKLFYEGAPDDILLVTSLALIYGMGNKYEEANMLFNHYLEKNNYEEAKLVYINFLYDTKQFDLTLDYLNKYINEYPDNNMFVYYKYLVLSEKSDHKNALETIQSLYEKVPQNSDYAVNYATELSYSGNIAESLSILDKQGNDKSKISVILAYFNVYVNGGNYDKAINIITNYLVDETDMDKINQTIKNAIDSSIEKNFSDKILVLLDSLLKTEDKTKRSLYTIQKACIISIDNEEKAKEMLENLKYDETICELLDTYIFSDNKKIQKFLSEYNEKNCQGE